MEVNKEKIWLTSVGTIIAVAYLIFWYSLFVRGFFSSDLALRMWLVAPIIVAFVPAVILPPILIWVWMCSVTKKDR